MTHASEGGTHWYSRDGLPVYEVPSADGKSMVNPDIRHARKLGLLPGFTSVNKVLYSFGLERYKIRQGILAALTLPRNEGEDDDSYFKRLEEDRQAHAKGRADEGTAIHAAIQQHLEGRPYDVKWAEHVGAVVKLLGELPPSFLGDFKTVESIEEKEAKYRGKDKSDALFYDDHVMQLAAYARGIHSGVSQPAIPWGKFVCEATFAHRKGYGGKVDVVRIAENDDGGDFPLVSIIISVKEPGLVRHRIWEEDAVKRGLGLFDSALEIWKLRNYYRSEWT